MTYHNTIQLLAFSAVELGNDADFAGEPETLCALLSATREEVTDALAEAVLEGIIKDEDIPGMFYRGVYAAVRMK